MGIIQAALLPDDHTIVETTPYNYRILVVDDNEASAKTLMWTMEMLGHTVQAAFDGQTAITIAKTFLPEIVVLDIGMPGMNGYETCQAMHKILALNNTTFIALTGWGQEEHKQRSKEAGFTYHLVKPLDMPVIKAILLILDKKRYKLG